MATRFTYSYLFTLSGDPGGALLGSGRVDPAFGARVLGSWGQSPSVRVDDGKIVITTSPAERPRWWVRGDARRKAPHFQRSCLAMEPSFRKALVKPGDELLLALDANAHSSLVIRRNARPVLAVGPSSVDVGGKDSVAALLRDLLHEPILTREDFNFSWNPEGRRFDEFGPWRIVLLRPKDQCNWGLAAIWCVFHVDVGVDDQIPLAIARQFTEAKFLHEPW